MPVTPTFPGVYIDEVASSVHTITGVPTAIAAFVGSAPRGPTDAPVHITSFADYQRIFGGVTATSPLSYAVYQFYLNGGSEAEVVRVVRTTDTDAAKNAKAATVVLKGSKGTKTITLTARGEGEWADTLRVRVDYDTSGAANSYNLAIFDSGTRAVLERFRNVVADPNDANSLDRALGGSAVLTVDPSAEDVASARTRTTTSPRTTRRTRTPTPGTTTRRTSAGRARPRARTAVPCRTRTTSAERPGRPTRRASSSCSGPTSSPCSVCRTPRSRRRCGTRRRSCASNAGRCSSWTHSPAGSPCSRRSTTCRRRRRSPGPSPATPPSTSRR